MGKLLKGCGVIFIILIVAFVALLLWSNQAGSQMQEQFFTAVGSGQPAQLKAQMAPELAAKLDDPILALWMNAIKTTFGNFQGIEPNNFNTSSKTENGVSKKLSEATVKFDKGTVRSKLELVNDQLISFNVETDKLGNWMANGPADTALYRERGQEVLNKLLTAQIDAAFAMMHDSMQKALLQQKAVLAGVAQKAGGLKSITYKSETLQPASGTDSPTLTVLYDVVCDKAATVASVNFQFSPFKGHIVAYNLTAGGQ